jgi:uncharacterized protein
MILQPEELRPKEPLPGVSIDEAVRPGKAVFQTGVPLFIGFGQSLQPEDGVADAGGRYAIHRFSRWEQFGQAIRIDRPEGYLDYAVRGFFQNGGERCVVVCLNAPEHGGYALARSLNALFEPIRGPLEDLADIDLVCAPDIMMQSIRKLPGVIRQVQQRLLGFCRRMGDRFAILDSAPLGGGDRKPPFDRASLRGILDERRALTHAVSTSDRHPEATGARSVTEPVEGALYFPWLRVPPLPRHGTAGFVPVPPSGHVAGIYARSDRRVGVFKAPANEELEGVGDLEVDLDDGDLAILNQAGVNCLRPLPGRGIRVWGARTLSDLRQWRYVNVRRLFVTLVRWIDRHMQEVVFEPHGPPLWDRVSDRIGAYCYALYNRGALKGSRPAEAFFVRCNAETNPPETRSRGQLVCEVGLAPLVPAEFIVVRLTQNQSGTTALHLSAP